MSSKAPFNRTPATNRALVSSQEPAEDESNSQLKVSNAVAYVNGL